MFRKLRISLLLYVLVMVAMTTWSARARNTDWNDPLWVVVYPINGEQSESIADYIRSLSEDEFRPIESMMAEQAERWGVRLNKPIDIKFAPVVESIPPAPPTSSNPLKVAFWSLQLRWWAWRNDTFDGPSDVQLFAVYYDPEKHATLAHSLGLQKGFLGVVNGFGKPSYVGRNNVVLAHEMLHTLGASDKYDPRNNQAIFPEGFAEPDSPSQYPQKLAEIMAGRIPISNTESKMPKKLSQTVVGKKTAREIGWIE
jgi:hypothetical protein